MILQSLKFSLIALDVFNTQFFIEKEEDKKKEETCRKEKERKGLFVIVIDIG